jgi:hypothetical protein
MNDQYIERKRAALGDLKQFSRAEMARDLARRHGKSVRLPWDAEEQQADVQQPTEELDSEALSALEGLVGGN